MNRLLVVVAALLLIQPIKIDVAAAAENPEHFTKHANANLKQKKAEKLLMMMKSLGISNPNITALVNTVDANTKNGYLMLHKEDLSSGTLSLSYKLEPKIGVKQLELLYIPKDSNTEYKARTNAVMVNYKLKF